MCDVLTRYIGKRDTSWLTRGVAFLFLLMSLSSIRDDFMSELLIFAVVSTAARPWKIKTYWRFFNCVSICTSFPWNCAGWSRWCSIWTWWCQCEWTACCNQTSFNERFYSFCPRIISNKAWVIGSLTTLVWILFSVHPRKYSRQSVPENWLTVCSENNVLLLVCSGKILWLWLLLRCHTVIRINYICGIYN